MRIVVVRGPESAGPFDLSSGPNIIGREPGCTVRLVSKRVSRKHAVAFLADGRLKVSDLGSANGLFDEAGHRADAVLLTPGRKVQVGDFVLRFESDEVGGELDLDDDDPLTADDDLVLEDMDEETPARSGPLPVLRAPESKPARSARPLPRARPAADFVFIQSADAQCPASSLALFHAQSISFQNHRVLLFPLLSIF